MREEMGITSLEPSTEEDDDCPVDHRRDDTRAGKPRLAHLMKRIEDDVIPEELH